MPRPVVKRNRLATRAPGTSRQTQSHDTTRDNVESRDISQSPIGDVVGSSRLTNSADPSDIIRQLRNQTPLIKAQEFAIGSSPGTEQGATGSRPPTRARGYSSTLSIVGRKGDTNSRIPGTPAFESSILSNFRRRPRQASILHMMQDEDGSSALDDDDFLGGLSPEDESTPLNISRGRSLVLRPAPFPEKSPSLPSSGKSSKRKRSAEKTQASQSPLNIASSTPGSRNLVIEPRQREVSVDLPRPPQSPAAFSETMVPPMSSPVSGLTYEMSTPDLEQLPPQTKEPPNLKPRNLKAAQPSDGRLHIATAALQDKLLPRRRRRRVGRESASSFEALGESDEDELASVAPDDDELSYSPLRKPSQTRGQSASKPNPGKTDSKPDEKDPKTIRQYRATSFRKETSGGKENEPTEMSSPLSSALDSNELSSEFDLEQEAPVKAYLSEELRVQALKFAEVDKWQLEFEDVITVKESGVFR